MILVTLGTQDKEFPRLLNAIEKQIEKGNIKDNVVVQAGNTRYTSDKMEIIDFIDLEKFSKMIKKCDLLITHGGVGSIITGLKNNKKIIGVPRLKKYREHENDHQLQILKSFEEKKYILVCKNLNKIDEMIKETIEFKPEKYESNSNKMIDLIEKEIDKFL